MSTDEKHHCGNPLSGADDESCQSRSNLSRRTLLKTAGAGILGGVALYGAK
jgi:hypothetical protein